MSSNEHNDGTPGPWYADLTSYDSTHGIYEVATGKFVGFVEQHRNAKRIVAAVNALAMLPTDEIEKLKPEDVRAAFNIRVEAATGEKAD
jgi:hypothetical protein